jgi:hypothetical protein
VTVTVALVFELDGSAAITSVWLQLAAEHFADVQLCPKQMPAQRKNTPADTTVLNARADRSRRRAQKVIGNAQIEAQRLVYMKAFIISSIAERTSAKLECKQDSAFIRYR